MCPWQGVAEERTIEAIAECVWSRDDQDLGDEFDEALCALEDALSEQTQGEVVPVDAGSVTHTARTSQAPGSLAASSSHHSAGPAAPQLAPFLHALQSRLTAEVGGQCYAGRAWCEGNRCAVPCAVRACMLVMELMCDSCVCLWHLAAAAGRRCRC
jgi:hypothetical protein